MPFVKKHIHIVATFVISFLFIMIGFAAIGLFPFGKNQIMVIDSWHQYYPFLQELQSKLQSGSSLFYSFNIGLGSNFILVMAYYAFSPLYLLSIIFPKEYLREFMMLATALKIALAGTFFAIYLRGVFKRDDYTITGFGLLYAFCGYAVGYYWNVMWLDAMALLPLIILGLHRIIDGEGFTLYVVTLAIAMISNFYIGFFICEFIVIYYLALYFMKTSGFSFGAFVKKSFLAAFFSLLAVGIAAVVLVPTYRGLQLTHAVNSTFPTKFETYFSVLEILNNMLPGVQPSVKSGLPNIFSGFIAIYMLAVYFVSTHVKIKEKAISFLLIVFFILSFNINTLNYIWHGFKFPNEVPYRFAFVFSFMIITWAYQGFKHFDELPRKHIWVISLGFLGYLLLSERFDLKSSVFYVSLGALAMYSILFLMYRYETIRYKAYMIGLSVLILSEALLSSIIGTTTTGSSARTTYPYLGDDIKAAVNEIYESDEDLYRIEMTKWYSTNDPTLYGYRGVSMFSSTVNSNISKFTQKLGIAASPESNRYLFAASTPLVNGLMGVKYFLGRDHGGTDQNAGYALKSQTGKVSIYENKYPLPIGFVVDYSVYNWNNSFRSPFDVQKDFILTATGMEVDLFKNVEVQAESYTNMTRNSQDNIRYSYSNNDSGQVGNATLTFFAPETKQMYFYMFANRSYKTNVTVNEKKQEYETRRGLIVDLGVLEAGTEIKLEFEVHAAKDGYFNLQMVTFDEEKYVEVHDALSREPFEVTSFKDTKIEGTVTAGRDGILYTSIPYEPGWKAKVNGVEVFIDPIHNAMIAIPVERGTHDIVLTYIPDGLLMGLSLSILSIAFAIGLYYKYEKRQNKHVSTKKGDHLDA